MCRAEQIAKPAEPVCPMGAYARPFFLLARAASRGGLLIRVAMTLSLERCDADALHRWGWSARAIGEGHATLESAARALTRYFYEALQADGPDGPERACALVRCYKTHPYGSLPPDLQRVAQRLLRPDERAAPGMRCVALLASAGDEERWNSRYDARSHSAIPLPTAASVARWPMIAQLASDFGLDAADLIEPSPNAAVARRRGRNYGVFHVEEVLGSTVIPAQAALVRRYGIRSVVGFGGALSTGDFYTIMLFSRVPVTPEVAAQFRLLSLHVKSAFFGFGEHDAFDLAPAVVAAGAAS